jgi:MFS family permease
MAAANFFDLYGMVQVMLPIYAIRELELSPAGYGLAVSLANVGGLLGVLLNGRVVGRIGVGPAMLASSVLPGIGVLLLAVATPATALPVIVASLGLAGFGIAVFNVNQMSLRQHVTPAHMLGRMNATVRFIIWGMIPAGAFAGGVLMDVIGAGTALVIAGAGSLVSALPLVLSGFGAVRAMSDAEGAA